MQQKIETKINSLLFNLKQYSPKLSNLAFQSSDRNEPHHHSFQEAAKKVVTIQKSLSAMGYKFKMLRPGRLRGGAITRVKLARLRQSLVFRIIIEFRNELKILLYSKQEVFTAPGALFSWFQRDFKSRTFLSNRLVLVDKLEDASAAELRAAKVNADIRGLIETAEYVGDNIANSADYEGIIKLVEDMKEFFNMQNKSIKEYIARKELISSLEERIKAGEDTMEEKLPGYSSQESVRLLEDDVHIDEELMHLTMEMEVVNRYKRSHFLEQSDQLEFKTFWAEAALIRLIEQYDQMYMRENKIFEAIAKANEHVINQLEDQVSIESQQYENECDEKDLEINRKKNEILATIDKLQTMQKKYEETKEEIGDQIPMEVEPATIWTVLDKLILARIAKQKAEEEAALLRKSQKKKGKKGKGAAKEAVAAGTDKASEKGSEKASEKGSEKGSERGSKKGSKKGGKKGKDKDNKRGSEKGAKKGSTKGAGKATKTGNATKSIQEIEATNEEVSKKLSGFEIEEIIEVPNEEAVMEGSVKASPRGGKKAPKKGKEKENKPEDAEGEQGIQKGTKKAKPKGKKAK